MRSSVLDILPGRVKKSLETLGSDIAVARRKRGFTVATMAERTGVSKTTYLRVEKGDPTVMLGAYAMTLFVLGFGESLGRLVEPARDEIGLALDQQRLPKRIRVKKARAAP